MKTIRLLFLHLLLLFLFSIAISQPAAFSPRGAGGGGSLYFPGINPLNKDEFYVSCDMSGLYHSADFGNTYSLVHHSQMQVFATSTYEFTGDPETAYCNFNDGNDGYPVKTVDGGDTWNIMPGYQVGTYGHVYKMAACHSDPDRLVVNSYGDILYSGDGGNSFSVVKHAADMGMGIILGGVFWDDDHIFIGTNEGLIVSSDAGASFSMKATTGIPAGQVIWEFAGAKSGAAMRFACITANYGDTYNGLMPWDYYGFARGVYTMDNDNGMWIARSAGIDFGNDFIMYLAMAENDISTIYLGGHDEGLSAPLVFKSADGGVSWSKVFNTVNNANIITGWEGAGGDKAWSWSESVFGISVAPYDPDRILFGNFSNVQSSTDGGTTWRQAYVNRDDEHPAGSQTPQQQAYSSIGLENTSCWQVHWVDSNSMLAAYSDIGAIKSTDAGKKWGFTYSGFSVNTVYRFEETVNGNLYAGCSDIHDIYQSTRLTDARLDAADGNGRIVYSADGGANWSTLHYFGHPVFWLAADPGYLDRMYASVIHFGGIQGAQLGGIYVTENLSAGEASSWTKLPNPSRTEGHPACIIVLNDGSLVCTFSARMNPSGAFTASSGVFVYHPATGSWSDVSDPGMYYWTMDIVVDPADVSQDTWYAGVYSGWGGPPNGLGGCYRTTDRGASWTKLTGSRFDRVTSVTINPQEPDQAYLTTETQGLWMTNDLNVAQPSWNLVTAYPFRQPERVFFNPYNNDEVWVTSFGNGIRVGTTGTSGSGEVPADDPEIIVCQDLSGNLICTSMGQNFKGPLLINIYDIAGRMVKSVSTYDRTVNISGLNPGIYLVEFDSGNHHNIKKLVIR